MAPTESFDAVRAAIMSDSGEVDESRVEVNQRALIDKILARYASAGAVYRELLQNSNDAEATNAEIRIATSGFSSFAGDSSSASSSSQGLVAEVAYRNDGHPFRTQDWFRLRKIAEGNPDVAKVGAFGVGAYTMFSIAENPMVISGGQALAFVWKGDSLWTKSGPAPKGTVAEADRKWTTFVLPSRDPYPVPDMVELGQFLVANLTFTQCLRAVRVYVDGDLKLTIAKSQIEEPRVVSPPKASSWWKNDGALTSSSRGIFTLGSKDGSITETVMKISCTLEGETSSIRARYVSAKAHTRVPADMAKRMERVTKKKVPPRVNVQIFVDADANAPSAKKRTGGGRAAAVTASFSPPMGSGRIFIGFRTSQTTGLAAHLAAPFVPTVEREAMDLQDPALRVYNTELLEVSGILMRLLLEHAMDRIGARWAVNLRRYADEDKRLKQERLEVGKSAQLKALETGKTEKETKKGGDSWDTSSKSTVYGFAKYMAKGMKKKIVDVIKTVDDIASNFDESAELLKPYDPRPLSSEERDAIVLMRAFCPTQSTPDADVGTAVASGFARCMPNLSPPVLTRTGVVRGGDARLPNGGMEAFAEKNTVRRIMYENAKEYHDVVARCRKVTITDVEEHLKQGEVLEEPDVVRLLQWWARYSRVDASIVPHGRSIKESVLFFPKKKASSQSESTISSDDDAAAEVLQLRDVLYYVDRKVLPEGLPLPDSVLPQSMMAELGMRVLQDASLRQWFSCLPVDVWASFVAEQPCLTDGKVEDNEERIRALGALCAEYKRREGSSEAQYSYGKFLRNLLSEKRCIPFQLDTSSSTPGRGLAADYPGDLFLSSAELAAFSSLQTFRRADPALRDVGVSDSFLLVLGVRKTVSVDFLFAHLDALQWSEDPRPLFAYLRSAKLSEQDLRKLRTTQFLPGRGDQTRKYAASEVFLPNPELEIFPFVTFLQWPEASLSEKSVDGNFLRALGCQVNPSLQAVVNFVERDVGDDKALRTKCLDFLYGRVGPGEVYEREFGQHLARKLLPCIRKDPLGLGEMQREIHGPSTCYHDPTCVCMGFPIVDPELEQRSGRDYGRRLRCAAEPTAQQVVSRLLEIVTSAKRSLEAIEGKEYLYQQYCDSISAAFDGIFNYLSTRTNEFDKKVIKALQENAFIPVREGDFIEWHLPHDVYFMSDGGSSEKGSLTSSLFHVIEFHPFLSSVGVKSEPSTHDLFQLLLSSPRSVLQKLGGEANYISLLRRIAADPPFGRVTKEMAESPFLLAYCVESEDNESGDVKDSAPAPAKYVLAKARDIFIIDNSFFGRMFPVPRAPHESDLEEFYALIGSSYISNSVKKTFNVTGRQRQDTDLTLDFWVRLRERRPLLVSPSVTSRPLVSDAASVLSDDRLVVVEAESLRAVYSLGSSVKVQSVTCSVDSAGRKTNVLYISPGFDWFDVGNAIGGLILQRCQLEDAFLIGSLLEAPLDQLKARGFPVDRVLNIRPVSPPVPVKDSSEQQNKSTARADNKADHNESRGEGFETILQQMFPDCDEAYIKAQVGDNPSIDRVKEVADSMASGNYPKKAHSSMPQSSPSDSSASQSGGSSVNDHKRKFRVGKKLGRMLGGKGKGTPSSGGQLPAQVQQFSSQIPPVNAFEDNGGVKSPERDVSANKHMEQMLKDSVDSAKTVDSRGVSAPETLVTNIPEGLDRGSNGCEVIPAQDLKPFQGPYGTGTAQNGMKVFSARGGGASSERFLSDNFRALDVFAGVLQTLCERVFSLRASSVAIYHDPLGTTIAFNAGRSLHFNLRYFCSLHYRPDVPPDSSCYSYWFTVMAHELAHNLVSAHNKDHGFYTESYVILYIPKLAVLFQGSAT